MIATNEATDVLRHGWQDAAALLAADVPEVAELLRARLEVAISARLLDEQHLLDTIEEVEAVTAQAGSASGQALARRLRRTVYEYLLALDAVHPDDVVQAGDAVPASPPGHTAGADRDLPTGLSAASSGDHASAPVAEAATGAGAEALRDAGVDPEGEADVQPPRRRFTLRRRQRDGDAATETEPDAEAEADTAVEPAAADEEMSGPTDILAAAWHIAAPAAPDASDAEAAVFLAPRAGFHIVEGDDGATPAADAPRLAMPVFAGDAAPPEEAVAPEPAEDPAAEAAPEFVSWQPSVSDGGLLAAHPAPEVGPTTADEAAPPAGVPPLPPAAEAAAAEPTPAPVETDDCAAATAAPVAEVAVPDPDLDPEDDGVHQGWRVRDHGEAGRKRGGPRVVAAEPEEDPFGSNPRLAETRRRIEERLHRKRCDEAAALLQALAHETGGRAVADLAMNAGDRCRALGKANAALNCYLAASRSDPVYELPLSRLADVCIDSQETELAVSYLERVARLYRFRGDDKEALRVYRRIATIAPYREDVLTLLMNAQRSGRLD